MILSNYDRVTTFIASIKVIFGFILSIILLYREVMEYGRVLIIVLALGYLIFSWLQGYYTNKVATERIKRINELEERLSSLKEEY
jgi:hypothetical protein